MNRIEQLLCERRAIQKTINELKFELEDIDHKVVEELRKRNHQHHYVKPVYSRIEQTLKHSPQVFGDDK